MLVSDDGPGVDPAHQEMIFKRYSQVKECAIVPRKGHGLGLSIVQHIVEKLGGEVGVESEVGAGSVFSFTLPASDS